MRVTDVRHPRCIVGHGRLRIPAEAEQTMGMPVANQRYWTVEDVWALPAEPGVRYEAVDGELLVTPAPTFLHQRAVLEIATTLNQMLQPGGLGEAVIAPSDVLIPPTQVLQPDVYVIRPLAKVELRLNARAMPLPMLAVEVLSPPSARFDRLTKRLLYQRAGIEYWIVDLDARLVERWMPDAERPEICADVLEWQPVTASSMLRLDWAALLARVHGDA